MAKVLDDLSSACLELDVSEEAEKIRYTDSDIMNALTIFNHVVGNYVIHNLIDKDQKEDSDVEKIHKEWKRLADWFKEVTGLDSRTYYQDKK